LSSLPEASEPLARALAGDVSALKLVLTSVHEPVAARVGRRIPPALRRVVDLDDLLQDTYVEVVRGLPRFENRGLPSFERWVCTIALNRLRNIVKAHRTLRRGGNHARVEVDRRLEDSTITLLDVVGGSSWTASRSAARAEAVDAVRAAIADLPSRYRVVVNGVYIEGRLVADVAREIGRTERAVHGLCRRGLRLLRDALHSGSRFLGSKS